VAAIVLSWSAADDVAPARDLRPARHASARAARVPDGDSATAGTAARETGFGMLVDAPVLDAGRAQGDDYSYSNFDPRSRAEGRHDRLELAVLQEIIDLNGLTESSSSTDTDNGDGRFEPLEFGSQIWCGGHLRELYTGPSEYFSYGYPLKQLPETLGDLRHLTRLNLNSNQLQSLPQSIGQLRKLRVLEVYANQLRELPGSLESLESLEVLQARGNQLREIPEGIAELPNLAAIFVTDNPIERWPERLRTRPTQTAPTPRVVRRRADCSPEP
jgi:hypothetical protein